MIIGIQLRHFKAYKGLTYVPITSNQKNNLSLYVGNNGVGKSSVFEALDALLNNAPWNRSKETKKDETFITGFFLIEKQHFISECSISDEDVDAISSISDRFWEVSEQTGTTLRQLINSIQEIKSSLTFQDYFLLGAGCTYSDRNKAYFGSSLDPELRTFISENHGNFNLDKVLTLVRSYYSLVYLPVESKVSNALKLESLEMKKLMNKDILNTIDGVLKAKISLEKGSSVNAVDYLNRSLNTFMDEINEQVREIDPLYSFKVDDGFKKNLTAYDLREKILEAYFSIRTLKKDSKEINELSSGEQRIALIDIATAFLAGGTERKGRLILAIDEPEASLHISNCYKQFKRLESLTRQDNFQLLMTTHWYGALPTLQHGTMSHIENINSKASIKTFNLQNYLEDQRDFPNDIELKSFFELVSTIVSSVRNDNSNWIICEGSDDRLYLEEYIENVPNLNILPVGGIGNVIKLYEYLVAPFSETREKLLLKSKVLCLMDSDRKQLSPRISQSTEGNLSLRRIQLNSDGTTQLIKPGGNGDYEITTLEDCLDPLTFYPALKSAIADFFPEFLEKLEAFDFDSSVTHCRLSVSSSFLKLTVLEGIEYKEELIGLFKSKEFKYILAEHYKKLGGSLFGTPSIFTQIEDFFKS